MKDYLQLKFRILAILAIFVLLASSLVPGGIVRADSGQSPETTPTSEPPIDPSPTGTVLQGGGIDSTEGGKSAGISAGSLTYFGTWTVYGGYVSAGTAMRNLGKGTITINGIPASSSVQKAFLFWNIISETSTNGNTRGTFNGTPIIGTMVQKTDSPCWSNGYSRTYRADVTSLVNATNRDYSLTGFASGITDGTDPWSSVVAPLNEGASLVIIYNQSRYPLTTVLIYNGAVMKIKTFPSYPSYLAYTTFIVADGQTDWTKIGGFFNGYLQSKADFDGTDPKFGGGSYLNGNLWDTETASSSTTAYPGISVGKRIPAYSTSATVKVDGGGDCLVHVAQVLSVSNGDLDTDGDGLRDSWEANGYNSVNLPALNANPFHKDVFLEVDWMADALGEFSHKPSTTVVSGMKASFQGGKVINPDRKTGIFLHVDVSNSIPHAIEFTTTAGCGDLFSKLETTKTANMAADRYPIYHYQLWVHNLCTELTTTSGYAQAIPGDDSFVSLGGWTDQGVTNARIGTGLHELGHTLNLRHGYPTGASTAGNGGSDDPYTPNHLSIMSYLYQVVGLIKNGNYGTFDYQRWDLPSLNESCLDETRGVGITSSLDLYGLYWITGDGFGHQNMTNGSANGPVNWNSNGSSADTCASVSINNDTDLETLNATKAEWALIVYNGGAVGFGLDFGLDRNGVQIPVHFTVPLVDKELTFEESEALNPQ
jgi:hypothetical protein